MSDNKKVLKWVGLGCGIAFLLGVCGIGVCVAGIGGIAGIASGPADAGHAMLGSLRANDTATAYTHMSPLYRSTHTVVQFQTQVAQIPGMNTHTDATFSQRSVNNGTGEASGHLTTPTGNLPIRVTGHIEGEVWFIDTVTVGPHSIP